jgi:hypothetical protein
VSADARDGRSDQRKGLTSDAAYHQLRVRTELKGTASANQPHVEDAWMRGFRMRAGGRDKDHCKPGEHSSHHRYLDYAALIPDDHGARLGCRFPSKATLAPLPSRRKRHSTQATSVPAPGDAAPLVSSTPSRHLPKPHETPLRRPMPGFQLLRPFGRPLQEVLNLHFHRSRLFAREVDVGVSVRLGENAQFAAIPP